EMLTAAGHPTAHYQLLARACSETIEHDRQGLTVHAPPGHGVHPLVQDAGGIHHNHESDQGEVFMVRVGDPLKLLAMLGPELDAGGRAAGVGRDAELGLEVDRAKWRLVYTRRGFRVRSGKLGRSYLSFNQAEFTRLVLGHGSVRETAFAGRLQASTQ